jgi:hypothetical protein
MKATPCQQIDFLKEKINESCGNSAPAAFVLLNFHQAGNNDQFPAKKQEQKTVSENNQFPVEKDDQPSTQTPLKNKVAPDSPKTAKESYQQAAKKDDQQTKLSAGIIAATEKLLYTAMLHADDCLFLLTRFALGQLVRQRKVTCRAEIVELNETPNLSRRRAAVNMIMKYHTIIKQEHAAPEPAIEVNLREYASMAMNSWLPSQKVPGIINE